MKVILNPSVYVIGRTVFSHAEFIRFTNAEGVRNPLTLDASCAENLTEASGRLCYMSFDNPRPGGNAAYIARLKEQRHGSVLEHASYSFLITGVSRSLTHELIRHRAGFAFSQLSQRYVDASEVAFVKPVEIQAEWEDEQREITRTLDYNEWYYGCVSALERYKTLVEVLENKFKTVSDHDLMIQSKSDLRKRVRQIARSVLPNSTETKIVVTANCRAIRHFLEQRGSAGAEPEIRRLANVILDIVQADSPNIFGDYQRYPYSDGTYLIGTDYPKV